MNANAEHNKYTRAGEQQLEQLKRRQQRLRVARTKSSSPDKHSKSSSSVWLGSARPGRSRRCQPSPPGEAASRQVRLGAEGSPRRVTCCEPPARFGGKARATRPGPARVARASSCEPQLSRFKWPPPLAAAQRALQRSLPQRQRRRRASALAGGLTNAKSARAQEVCRVVLLVQCWLTRPTRRAASACTGWLIAAAAADASVTPNTLRLGASFEKLLRYASSRQARGWRPPRRVGRGLAGTQLARAATSGANR